MASKTPLPAPLCSRVSSKVVSPAAAAVIDPLENGEALTVVPSVRVRSKGGSDVIKNGGLLKESESVGRGRVSNSLSAQQQQQEKKEEEEENW